MNHQSTNQGTRATSRAQALQRTSWWLTGLIAVTVVGCAPKEPAESVVTAQESYADVSDGPAATYAPDELHEAKKLLSRAESAKNGSDEQAHFAYLADRQARIAHSSGKAEHYGEERADAQAAYIDQVERDRTRARENLEQTREALEKVRHDLTQQDANIEELEKKKRELEIREAALAGELEQSEQARQEAEQNARDALASLQKLANVKEEKNRTVITLSGSVLFETGKSSLLPMAKNSLSKVADALTQMEDEKSFVVEGHTDSRGASKMNKDLSQERAESVREFLISEGVEASRVKAVGKGEEEPVANNESPEGRANNRRVEVHINNGDGEDGATASR